MSMRLLLLLSLIYFCISPYYYYNKEYELEGGAFAQIIEIVELNEELYFVGNVLLIDKYCGFVGRMSLSGNIEWIEEISNSYDTNLKRILMDADKETFVVLGTTDGGMNNVVFCMKYFVNGTVEWTRSYVVDPFGWDSASGISRLNNGDYLISSFCEEGGCLTRVSDVDGSVVSFAHYERSPENQWNYFEDHLELSDGSIIVAGKEEIEEVYHVYTEFFKFNESLSLELAVSYSGYYNPDQPLKLFQLDDGNIGVMGLLVNEEFYPEVTFGKLDPNLLTLIYWNRYKPDEYYGNFEPKFFYETPGWYVLATFEDVEGSNFLKLDKTDGTVIEVLTKSDAIYFNFLDISSGEFLCVGMDFDRTWFRADMYTDREILGDCGGVYTQPSNSVIVIDLLPEVSWQNITDEFSVETYISSGSINLVITDLLDTIIEKPSTCSRCDPNFYGPYCNITTCFGFFSNETEIVCFGHGECIQHENCSCDDGYTFYDCGTWSCFGVDKYYFDEVCKGPVSIFQDEPSYCIDIDTCDCGGMLYGKKCEVFIPGPVIEDEDGYSYNEYEPGHTFNEFDEGDSEYELYLWYFYISLDGSVNIHEGDSCNDFILNPEEVFGVGTFFECEWSTFTLPVTEEEEEEDNNNNDVPWNEWGLDWEDYTPHELETVNTTYVNRLTIKNLDKQNHLVMTEPESRIMYFKVLMISEDLVNGDRETYDYSDFVYYPVNGRGYEYYEDDNYVMAVGDLPSTVAAIAFGSIFVGFILFCLCCGCCIFCSVLFSFLCVFSWVGFVRLFWSMRMTQYQEYLERKRKRKEEKEKGSGSASSSPDKKLKKVGESDDSEEEELLANFKSDIISSESMAVRREEYKIKRTIKLGNFEMVSDDDEDFMKEIESEASEEDDEVEVKETELLKEISERIRKKKKMMKMKKKRKKKKKKEDDDEED